LHAGEEIVGVVAGRLTPVAPDRWFIPPEYDVSRKAKEHFLPLYEPKPSQLNKPEFLEVIRKAKPDYIISGYYAKIFSDELLSIPKIGCVNFHPARLPHLRGLTPHFSHMLLGDKKNYATLHWLDQGVDTGDIIGICSIDIKPEHTGFETGRLLTEAGMEMFRENWPKIKKDTAPRLKQNDANSGEFYFSWDLAEINWTQSAIEIWNIVRSLTRPLGGAWTMAGGYKMNVWEVKVVPSREQISVTKGFPLVKPLPGQVIAMTGKGMWIQCGKGQMIIKDAKLEDKPDTSPFELLSGFPGGIPVLLG
jgi:methionyl-tRNA formyltransferase